MVQGVQEAQGVQFRRLRELRGFRGFRGLRRLRGFRGFCSGGSGAPTCEQLRSHVDGGAHDAAGHHRLGLAETQICDLGPILFVQLGGKKSHRQAGEKLISAIKY